MFVSPAAIASIIARNLVPFAGVVFLGWSAPNLLVLYFLDTLLSFAVVVLMIARHITGLSPDGGKKLADGPVDWARGILASLFAAAIISVPLGVPIFILLAQFDWSFSAAWADRAFVNGVLLQVVGSITGAIQAHRELLAREDDERILKRRAAFIMARAVVMVMASMTGFIGIMGARVGGALMVLVYAGASIYFELFPDRALQWLNPKEAATDAAKDAGAPPVKHRRKRRA